MPKPKTSPDLTPKPYRLLKTDLAAKLSARSSGGITYVLLADATDAPELHIAVTANEGGGLWSKEVVRLNQRGQGHFASNKRTPTLFNIKSVMR